MDAREFGTKLGKALKKSDAAPPSPPALKTYFATDTAPNTPKVQRSEKSTGKPPAKL
jgi:hypothetical protein